MSSALTALFNSLINPKRDFVNANTPVELEELFAPGSGDPVTASVPSGADINTYPQANLPPEWAEVFSQMPEARQTGQVNEQMLKDYTEALNVYNQGGKGERIASLLAGLAGTGGYIADRTSGDVDRRNAASGPGGDLDYALQGLFSIPGGMNARRRGDLKSSLDQAALTKATRTESLQALTGGKERDNYWNYMFRNMNQGAAEAQERTRASKDAAKARAIGVAKPPEFKDQMIRMSYGMFYDNFASQIGPDKAFATQADALDAFIEKHPLEAEFLEGGFLDDYKTARQSKSEDFIAAREIVEKQYATLWKNAQESGDPEEIKKVERTKYEAIRRELMRNYNWDEEDINTELKKLGIDLSTPTQVEEPEEPGILDDILGAARGLFGGGQEAGPELGSKTDEGEVVETFPDGSYIVRDSATGVESFKPRQLTPGTQKEEGALPSLFRSLGITDRPPRKGDDLEGMEVVKDSDGTSVLVRTKDGGMRLLPLMQDKQGKYTIDLTRFRQLAEPDTVGP
jgi:hypothetical protein